MSASTWVARVLECRARHVTFAPPGRVSAGWLGQQRHGPHVACTSGQLRPMVAAVKPTADTAVVKGAMTPGGVLT